MTQDLVYQTLYSWLSLDMRKGPTKRDLLSILPVLEAQWYVLIFNQSYGHFTKDVQLNSKSLVKINWY